MDGMTTRHAGRQTNRPLYVIVGTLALVGFFWFVLKPSAPAPATITKVGRTYYDAPRLRIGLIGNRVLV